MLQGSGLACVENLSLCFYLLLFLCGWGAEVSHCTALGVRVAVILHALADSFSTVIVSLSLMSFHGGVLVLFQKEWFAWGLNAWKVFFYTADCEGF